MKAAALRVAAVGVATLVAVVAPAAGAPPSTRADGPRSSGDVHEVRAGETLSGIARRYGVSVSGLVAANGLRGQSALVRVGQRLRIPQATARAKVAASKSVVRAGSKSAGMKAAGTKAGAGARRSAKRLDLMPKNLVLTVPDFTEIAPLFAWPVEGPVSSAFGRRRLGWHRGIDIKADLGMSILAAAPGFVVASGYETRYGRVVKIEHANGFVTVYAHNDENFVEAGDRIAGGQRIAAIGRTGRATAHHLHFEIRQAGLAYNPLYLLPLPPRVATVDEGEDEEHDEPDD